MGWPMPEHGTMNGYSWHIRHRIPVCDPCREAKRVTSKERATAARKQDREEAPRKEAWRRACSRMAEKYPAEFRELLMEEMRGLIVLPPEDDDEQGEVA